MFHACVFMHLLICCLAVYIYIFACLCYINACRYLCIYIKFSNLTMVGWGGAGWCGASFCVYMVVTVLCCPVLYSLSIRGTRTPLKTSLNEFKPIQCNLKSHVRTPCQSPWTTSWLWSSSIHIPGFPKVFSDSDVLCWCSEIISMQIFKSSVFWLCPSAYFATLKD